MLFRFSLAFARISRKAENRAPKRVAITIAGAVSPGRYEAGVAFGMLEAIRLHNEAIDATERPEATDEKIYVDVITGASAARTGPSD
jgi:hypothetical protein